MAGVSILGGDMEGKCLGYGFRFEAKCSSSNPNQIRFTIHLEEKGVRSCAHIVLDYEQAERFANNILTAIKSSDKVLHLEIN